MARGPPINTSFSRVLSLNILYALHILLLCTIIFGMFNAPHYKHSYNPSTHNLGVSVKLHARNVAYATYDFVKHGGHDGEGKLRYREMGGEKDNEVTRVTRETLSNRERLERKRELRAGH